MTNLSQDSGLTTSDSQLYAFEEDHHSFSSEEFDPNMLVPGSKESSRVSKIKKWNHFRISKILILKPKSYWLLPCLFKEKKISV